MSAEDKQKLEDEIQALQDEIHSLEYDKSDLEEEIEDLMYNKNLILGRDSTKALLYEQIADILLKPNDELTRRYYGSIRISPDSLVELLEKRLIASKQPI